MDSRFQIIFNDTEKYFQPGIDLILVSQLTAVDLQTGVCFGQVKFQNNFAKKIRGMVVSIRCFSQNDIELEGIDPFEFSSLSVPPRSVFGTNNTIIFPDRDTVFYSIQIQKILFFDGTEFINDDPADLMMIPEPKDISKDNDFSLYRKELKKYCSNEGIESDLLKYQVQKAADIWQCACGTINPSRETRCLLCGADLGDLLLFSNSEYLCQINTDNQQHGYISVKMKKNSTIEKELEDIKLKQKSEAYQRDDLLLKIEKQNQSNMKLMKVAAMFLCFGIVLMIGVFVIL